MMRDVAGEHGFLALRADEHAHVTGAVAGRRKHAHLLADAIAGPKEIGNAGVDDVRLTIRLREDDLSAAVMASLHEGGHGLYDQGFLESDRDCLLGEGPSMGLHESQSRLWENHIGRSPDFWEHWWPAIRDLFPDAAELDAAAKVAASLGAVKHLVAPINLRLFGGSALTDDLEVPKAGASDGIPITYVPARNTVFLSLALAWAEVLSSSDIFIGVNALDYSGYPDCRPEFIYAYARMANLATKAGVEGSTRIKIHTPLIRLSKAEIVGLGAKLGLDFGLTHSCYDPGPDGRPCGACDSCLLRRKGFGEAGVTDPLAP